MTRRGFLAGGVAAGAAQEKPQLRFLQVNDLHFCLSEGGYKDANRRIDWLFEQILARTFFPPIDFVVAIGDLVHGGKMEWIVEETPVLKEKLDGLGVPYYTVVGNHDNWQSERDARWEMPYRQAYGADRFDYSFVRGGVEFVILNNSGSATARPKEVFVERMRRLEGLLGAYPNLPKVLCCHIPLVSVRDEPVLKESFGFRSYRTMEPEVLEIVQAKASRVRVALSGHLHLTGAVRRGAVQHVSICGMASFPHEAALYSVYPGRIEAEVIRLPSHLLVPETNIHGSRRHGRDFTDERHAAPDSYLSGAPGERRWTLEL